MNQYPLNDYISLITKLLHCSEGEEWTLLRRYEHLINSELVQILKQIAHNFLNQGDSRSASVLSRWAGEITQYLSDKNSLTPEPSVRQSYDQLIQDLLTSPHGYELPIVAQYDSPLDEGLIQRIREVARQLAINGSSEKARYLMALAAQLEEQSEQWDSSKSTKQCLDKAPRQDSQMIPAVSSPQITSISESNSSGPDASLSLVSKNLELLSQSVERLVDLIAGQCVFPVTLNHLETLEKAQANKWLLTTHEIESLLGTKPHCSVSSKIYQRGGWRFVKCGKVGRDVLWQVFKIHPSSFGTTTDSSPSSSPSYVAPMEPDPWLT